MSRHESGSAAGGIVVVTPDGESRRFVAAFDIGRDEGCELQMPDGEVSRRHVRVSHIGGQWVIADLHSSNGLFVDGRRIERAAVAGAMRVRLGLDGPELRIAPDDVDGAGERSVREGQPEASVEDDAHRYFRSDDGEEVGGRTLMIRKAFQRLQQQQRRRTRMLVAAIAAVAVAASWYAWHEHRLVSQQAQIAEALFYSMKDLDVRIAQLEQQAAASGTAAPRAAAAAAVDRRLQESRYDGFVARVYDRSLNEKDRLVLRVTRLFGECEVAAPPDYLREVQRYITKWQQTGRFARNVKLSRERGLIQRIAGAFIAQNLPAQFYYLAMQESNFDTFAVGPPTRWGIAKGMWQFIPETGQRYGLRIGPLHRASGFDALDERFNWEKATDAASRYIKDIYSTDAQASGLLVMASYNWGEYRVVDTLRAMPADPRQRNFWRLLAARQVPFQTYDYVLNIVSAAVIGENPRLFGYDFDNPLKDVAGQ